jgi:hypothetical protein
LRYRVEMKKTTRKLIVRGETVRTLQPLDLRDLARVIGGDDGALIESHATCPAQAAVPVPK